VEQMIRVAAGEKLPFKQKDVRLDGWAIESRVYAEDPYRGFLPSIGRLVRYNPPVADAHQEPFSSDAPEGSQVERRLGRTRVDDGVAEGGEVALAYDPVMAQLIPS